MLWEMPSEQPSSCYYAFLAATVLIIQSFNT
jgi:hypothetical protein